MRIKDSKPGLGDKVFSGNGVGVGPGQFGPAALTCLPALLNALSMVGNALGFVSRLQDVALIARGTEERLCPVLSGTASLCYGGTRVRVRSQAAELGS